MSALENIVDEQKETKYLLKYKYNTMSCWFIVIYGCTFIYIRNILFVAFVMRRSVVRIHFPAPIETKQKIRKQVTTYELDIRFRTS